MVLGGDVAAGDLDADHVTPGRLEQTALEYQGDVVLDALTHGPVQGLGHLRRESDELGAGTDIDVVGSAEAEPQRAVDPAGRPQRQRCPGLVAGVLEQRAHVGEPGGGVLECHEDLSAGADRLGHGRRRVDVDGLPSCGRFVGEAGGRGEYQAVRFEFVAQHHHRRLRSEGPDRVGDDRCHFLSVRRERESGRGRRELLGARFALALVGHVLDDRGGTGDLAAGLDRSGAHDEGPRVAGRGPLPRFHVEITHRRSAFHRVDRGPQRVGRGVAGRGAPPEGEVGAFVGDNDPAGLVDGGDAHGKLLEHRLEELSALGLASVHPIEPPRCQRRAEQRHQEQEAERDEGSFELPPQRCEELVAGAVDDDEPARGRHLGVADDRSVDIGEHTVVGVEERAPGGRIVGAGLGIGLGLGCSGVDHPQGRRRCRDALLVDLLAPEDLPPLTVDRQDGVGSEQRAHDVVARRRERDRPGEDAGHREALIGGDREHDRPVRLVALLPQRLDGAPPGQGLLHGVGGREVDRRGRSLGRVDRARPDLSERVDPHHAAGEAHVPRNGEVDGALDPGCVEIREGRGRTEHRDLLLDELDEAAAQRAGEPGRLLDVGDGLALVLLVVGAERRVPESREQADEHERRGEGAPTEVSPGSARHRGDRGSRGGADATTEHRRLIDASAPTSKLPCEHIHKVGR